MNTLIWMVFVLIVAWCVLGAIVKFVSESTSVQVGIKILGAFLVLFIQYKLITWFMESAIKLPMFSGLSDDSPARFLFIIITALTGTAMGYGLLKLDFNVLEQSVQARHSKEEYEDQYLKAYKEVFSEWEPLDSDRALSATFNRLTRQRSTGNSFADPDNPIYKTEIRKECQMVMALQCAKKRAENQIEIDRLGDEYISENMVIDSDQEFYNPNDAPLEDPHEELKRLNLPIRARYNIPIKQ